MCTGRTLAAKLLSWPPRRLRIQSCGRVSRLTSSVSGSRFFGRQLCDRPKGHRSCCRLRPVKNRADQCERDQSARPQRHRRLRRFARISSAAMSRRASTGTTTRCSRGDAQTDNRCSGGRLLKLFPCRAVPALRAKARLGEAAHAGCTRRGDRGCPLRSQGRRWVRRWSRCK